MRPPPARRLRDDHEPHRQRHPLAAAAARPARGLARRPRRPGPRGRRAPPPRRPGAVHPAGAARGLRARRPRDGSRTRSIALLIGAGNRDPKVFDDPDRLDLARTPEPAPRVLHRHPPLPRRRPRPARGRARHPRHPPRAPRPRARRPPHLAPDLRPPRLHRAPIRWRPDPLPAIRRPRAVVGRTSTCRGPQAGGDGRGRAGRADGFEAVDALGAPGQAVALAEVVGEEVHDRQPHLGALEAARLVGGEGEALAVDPAAARCRRAWRPARRAARRGGGRSAWRRARSGGRRRARCTRCGCAPRTSRSRGSAGRRCRRRPRGGGAGGRTGRRCRG